MSAQVSQSIPGAVDQLRRQVRTRWQALAPRERTGLLVAGLVLLVFAIWSLLVAPAWRIARDAPAQLDQLDTRLQQMQRMAGEARDLRQTAPVTSTQSAEALKAATDRLGPQARLALLGDRATLTLSGVTGERLRQWLVEARSAARARVVEAQLSRGAQGFSGTVVLALAGSGGRS
jgi:general secretion pathway protein M